MKKTLIVLALVFLLAAPSYAAVQKSETGDFNAQVKTFLNKVFTSNKGVERAPTILKTETLQITSERGEREILNSPDDRIKEIRDISKCEEFMHPAVPGHWEISETNNECKWVWEKGPDEGASTNVSPGVNVQPSIKSGDNTQPSIGVEPSVESGSDVLPSTNVRPSVKNFGSKVRSLFNRSDTTAPVGPGEFRPADESQISQEVREKLELRREEVRQKIQFNQGEMETVKIEAQKRIQEKRAELNEKFQQIKNEQKRRAAEQIHQNLYNVREKILSNFSRTTNRLDTVLTNITTRADKMEVEGVNIENVREAIQDTQSQINLAHEQIRNLFQKEYDIQITGEETLREDFLTTRDELHNNLSDVKNIVKEAYQATRSAAMELTQSK